jgi:hypothetical protein
LLRKFTDLAFGGSAETRWQETERTTAENAGLGRVTDSDMQTDLFESSGNPF